MEKNRHAVYLAQCESAAKALRSNRMDAIIAENREELIRIIRELIPSGSTVASGGSQTLVQYGIHDILSQNYVYYRHGETPADSRFEDAEHAALCSDWFISSANAVTLNGELYFRDGNGNRLSAVAFGPKNVLIIAGANKIVKDLQEAEQRVRMTAAPMNCVRLNKQTGCRKTGYCINCKADDRICSLTLICSFQQNAGRIHVILLPEESGY